MKYFSMMENSRQTKVMLNLDSFLEKSSFCANGQFRVFEITLRSGGIPSVGGIRNFAGGYFFDIVVKGGHTALFSINPPFLRVPPF